MRFSLSNEVSASQNIDPSIWAYLTHREYRDCNSVLQKYLYDYWTAYLRDIIIKLSLLLKVLLPQDFVPILSTYACINRGNLPSSAYFSIVLYDCQNRRKRMHIPGTM